MSAVLTAWNLSVVIAGGTACTANNPQAGNATTPHSVALVDALGSDYPDQAFVNSINSSATSLGYQFDYYPPASVTLDLFLSLPRLSLSMIILRTHGGVMKLGDSVAIGTSIPYSQTSHVADQLLNRLTSVDVNGTRYFGLTSDFISKDMCGQLPGTQVLAMFCYGGVQTSLAQAFIDKGAGGYVGWNRFVTVSHTDLAFQDLVKLMLQGNSLNHSVEEVMSTLGPDPIYGSQLITYPAN